MTGNVTALSKKQSTEDLWTPKEYPVGKTFNQKGLPDKVVIQGREPTNHPQLRQVDPHHVHRKELLSTILAWMKIGNGDGLFLFGPTGAGKTSELMQVCAKLSIPVYRIQGHGRLELSDLVGHYVIQQDGSMEWVYGPLALAMKEGCPFLFDELDRVDPSVLSGAYAVLEGDPLTIAENGGETIYPAKGFMFAATGNTNGSGDTTGLVQGSLQQDIALLDRFWPLEVGYPDKETELKILKGEFGDKIGEQLLGTLIDIANDIRALFMGVDSKGQQTQSIEVTMSTRVLRRWCRQALFFKGLAAQGVDHIKHALDRSLTFRAAAPTREAIHKIVESHLGGNSPSS